MKISDAISALWELQDQLGDVEVIFAEGKNGEPSPTPVNDKKFPLTGWSKTGKPNGLVKRDGFNSRN